MTGRAPLSARRAHAVRAALVVLASLALVACERSTRSRATEATTGAVPVVVHLIDTLRADRTGPYGYRRGTTPTLDALAAESVVFEQAYAPAPWTLPSVASIMTSTFPCEHGVTRDGEQLAPHLAPLAERLRAARYATASFHANPYAGSMSALHRGYDVAAMHRRIEPAVFEAWLAAHAGERFFLYVHTVEPHDPWLMPRRLVRRLDASAHRYGPRYAQLADLYRGAGRLDFARGRARRATDVASLQRALLDDLNAIVGPASVLYDTAVLDADARLGRVIATLRRHGVWERTLFVVLSDHGEEMSGHDGWLHGQSVYDDVVRVPLIVKLPAAAHAGTRVSAPVSLVDLAPTVLDVVGEPELATGFRGSSLLPRIRGTAPAGDGPASVVSMRIDRKKVFWPVHAQRGDANVAVRESAWKAVFNVDRQTTELYDLARDPAERTPLADAHPEIAARLTEHARRWLAECTARSRPAPERPATPVPAETRERLRQLGYVDR